MANANHDVIYINGRFFTQNRTGIQRYSREVVSAIDRMLLQRECSPDLQNAEWILLAPPAADCDIDLGRIKFQKVGKGDGHLWEQTYLAKHSWHGRLLSPASSGPVWHPRHIVVVHDAGIYRAPSGYARSYRILHRVLDRMMAGTATIATVSYFSQAELSSCLQLPKKEILVAPNGTEHLAAVPPDRTIVERLGVEAGKYFVTLGLSTANKNIGLAIEAFRLLQRPDIKLVIVGKGSARVFGSLKLEAPAGVLMTGRLDDEEVTGLLQSATALLVPSRYEGFGIPCLEAMLHGCPVVASTAHGLLEICGGAALHCDPDRPDRLRDLMGLLLDHPEIGTTLRLRGSSQPARYSWNATAATFANALDALARQTAGRELVIEPNTMEQA